MKMTCGICGKEIYDSYTSCLPVKKGMCCSCCDVKFIKLIKLKFSKIDNWEVVNNTHDLEVIRKKLFEKNFEEINSVEFIRIYKNLETEETVGILINYDNLFFEKIDEHKIYDTL